MSNINQSVTLTQYRASQKQTTKVTNTFDISTYRINAPTNHPNVTAVTEPGGVGKGNLAISIDLTNLCRLQVSFDSSATFKTRPAEAERKQRSNPVTCQHHLAPKALRLALVSSQKLLLSRRSCGEN